MHKHVIVHVFSSFVNVSAMHIKTSITYIYVSMELSTVGI